MVFTTVLSIQFNFFVYFLNFSFQSIIFDWLFIKLLRTVMYVCTFRSKSIDFPCGRTEPCELPKITEEPTTHYKVRCTCENLRPYSYTTLISTPKWVHNAAAGITIHIIHFCYGVASFEKQNTIYYEIVIRLYT